MSYLKFGTKKILESNRDITWIDPKLIKDVCYKKNTNTDRYLYKTTYGLLQAGRLNISQTEFEIAGVIKNSDSCHNYYLMKDSFDHVVTVNVQKFVNYISLDNPSRLQTRSLNQTLACNITQLKDPTPSSEYFKKDIVICGPYTKLITKGKTYSTKCDKADVLDREKAVMLLLLQSQGFSYSAIQRMIENAKEYPWHEKGESVDKATITDKQDPITSNSTQTEYRFLRIKRFVGNTKDKSNEQQFHFQRVPSIAEMSNTLIYIPINEQLFEDMTAWVLKKGHSNYYKHSQVLKGSVSELRSFITIYNKAVKFAKLQYPTYFDWDTFPNPTECTLYMTKMAQGQIRITNMKSPDGTIKPVGKRNVPITQEDADRFNHKDYNKTISGKDKDYAYWNDYMSQSYLDARYLFLNKLND